LGEDNLTTIGELAAGAAHEIRNPLTGIKSSLQYLKTKSRDETENKLLKNALQETGRIDNILSALLSFSRPSEIKKESLPQTEVIIITAFGTIKNAVEATKLGAYDYLEKPVDNEELLLVPAKAGSRCRNDRHLHSIVIPAEAGIHSYHPHLLRSYQNDKSKFLKP